MVPALSGRVGMSGTHGDRPCKVAVICVFSRPSGWGHICRWRQARLPWSNSLSIPRSRSLRHRCAPCRTVAPACRRCRRHYELPQQVGALKPSRWQRQERSSGTTLSCAAASLRTARPAMPVRFRPVAPRRCPAATGVGSGCAVRARCRASQPAGTSTAPATGAVPVARCEDAIEMLRQRADVFPPAQRRT